MKLLWALFVIGVTAQQVSSTPTSRQVATATSRTLPTTTRKIPTKSSTTTTSKISTNASVTTFTSNLFSPKPKTSSKISDSDIFFIILGGLGFVCLSLILIFAIYRFCVRNGSANSNIAESSPHLISKSKPNLLEYRSKKEEAGIDFYHEPQGFGLNPQMNNFYSPDFGPPLAVGEPDPNGYYYHDEHGNLTFPHYFDENNNIIFVDAYGNPIEHTPPLVNMEPKE